MNQRQIDTGVLFILHPSSFILLGCPWGVTEAFDASNVADGVRLLTGYLPAKLKIRCSSDGKSVRLKSGRSVARPHPPELLKKG